MWVIAGLLMLAGISFMLAKPDISIEDRWRREGHFPKLLPPPPKPKEPVIEDVK